MDRFLALLLLLVQRQRLHLDNPRGTALALPAPRIKHRITRGRHDNAPWAVDVADGDRIARRARVEGANSQLLKALVARLRVVVVRISKEQSNALLQRRSCQYLSLFRDVRHVWPGLDRDILVVDQLLERSLLRIFSTVETADVDNLGRMKQCRVYVFQDKQAEGEADVQSELFWFATNQVFAKFGADLAASREKRVGRALGGIGLGWWHLAACGENLGAAKDTFAWLWRDGILV